MQEHVVFTECRQIKIPEEEELEAFSFFTDSLAILSWLFGFFLSTNASRIDKKNSLL